MMSYINETDFVIENKKLVYPEIVADGLQLYYDSKGKRDTDYHRDTMLDMSGNKNHGKLHNFAYEKHSGYKDGLVFDYIDDKLVRPTLNLKPDDFTFMLNGNIISFSPDGTVKRVQDGEVIESKGFNLVRDNNWRTHISTVINKYGKYVTTRKKREGIRTGIIQNLPILYEAGNVIYCKVEIEPLVDNLELIQYNLRGAIQRGSIHYDVIRQPEKNKTYTLESVYNVLDNTGEGETVIYIESGDSSSDNIGEDTMRIKEVQVISLTATFGAGNEPTIEEIQAEPDKWQWLPNPLDLLESEELKGNYLGDMENIIDGLYKTEVLSGEEIYTDQADDNAGVHVEVDGKSVGGGSGKNLFNAGDFVDNIVSNGVSTDRISLIDIETNYFKYKTVGNMHQYISYLNELFKEKTSYTLSLKGRLEDKTDDRAQTTFGFLYTDGSRQLINIGSTEKSFTLTTDPSKTIKQLNIGWSYNGTAYIRDIQLEEGSTATTYEPPAPTPDYPIAIHSLNDFDVVSSVGKRNYVRGMSIGNPDTSFSSSGRGSSIIQYDEENDGYYTKTSRTLNLANLPNGDYVFTFKAKRRYEGIGSYGVLGSLQTRINLAYKRDLPDDYQEYSARFTQNGERSWNATFYDSLFFKELSVVEESPGFSEINLAPEDITESDNHPLIDKINLLLDEPLRSVGDVKDRLFRDSDGVWKVERNTSETEVLSVSLLYNTGTTETFTTFIFVPPMPSIGYQTSRCSHFINTSGQWDRPTFTHYSDHTIVNNRYFMVENKVLGVDSSDSHSIRLNKINNWLSNESSKGTPVTLVYKSGKPHIEILDQALQDKLNNLRSFEDSNYVYTVLPNEDNYLSDNLKPTLHAKFLYNNWYKEDRVINNLMIYNRALTNEEMLQNYKTIKRRWGM